MLSGWVDDSIFTRRNPENDEEMWSNGSPAGGGAFTTGRSRGRTNAPPPPPAVKPRSQVRLEPPLKMHGLAFLKEKKAALSDSRCNFFLILALGSRKT